MKFSMTFHEFSEVIILINSLDIISIKQQNMY